MSRFARTESHIGPEHNAARCRHIYAQPDIVPQAVDRRSGWTACPSECTGRQSPRVRERRSDRKRKEDRGMVCRPEDLRARGDMIEQPAALVVSNDEHRPFPNALVARDGLENAIDQALPGPHIAVGMLIVLR